MNAKRLGIVAGAVALVLAVIGLVVARQRRLHPVASPASSSEARSEAAGIDYKMSPFLAMMNAPEGKTTCDTVYNAYRAFNEESKVKGLPPHWPNFPDEPTFLARCNALPPNEQKCMTPRYAAAHHPECDPINNRYDERNPLFMPAPSASPK